MSAPDIIERAEQAFAVYRGLGKEIIVELIDELSRTRAINTELYAALRAATVIAEEARQEWDAAPNGMRAGKLLIALTGNLKGYRPDIDAIHAAIAKARGETWETTR